MWCSYHSFHHPKTCISLNNKCANNFDISFASMCILTAFVGLFRSWTHTIGTFCCSVTFGSLTIFSNFNKDYMYLSLINDFFSRKQYIPSSFYTQFKYYLYNLCKYGFKYYMLHCLHWPCAVTSFFQNYIWIILR